MPMLIALLGLLVAAICHTPCPMPDVRLAPALHAAARADDFVRKEGRSWTEAFKARWLVPRPRAQPP